MPEPVTTVGLGALAAYLSKDGLNKLLGPTAEYLGEGLKEFTMKRIENIGRIFKKGTSKLGQRIERPGKVPPKVLKGVINEGSYCENELASEYFGGVLASSRTTIDRDDRGASILKTVDGLSTYQIRTHYLIYNAIRKLFFGSGYHFNIEDRPKMEIFIPLEAYKTAMKISPEENKQFHPLLSHSFFGLHNEALIENFRYGSVKTMLKFYKKATTAGIVCTPSAFGAELYLWAHGLGDKTYNYILVAPDFPSIKEEALDLVGCQKVSEDEAK